MLAKTFIKVSCFFGLLSLPLQASTFSDELVPAELFDVESMRDSVAGCNEEIRYNFNRGLEYLSVKEKLSVGSLVFISLDFEQAIQISNDVECQKALLDNAIRLSESIKHAMENEDMSDAYIEHHTDVVFNNLALSRQLMKRAALSLDSDRFSIYDQADDLIDGFMNDFDELNERYERYERYKGFSLNPTIKYFFPAQAYNEAADLAEDADKVEFLRKALLVGYGGEEKLSDSQLFYDSGFYNDKSFEMLVSIAEASSGLDKTLHKEAVEQLSLMINFWAYSLTGIKPLFLKTKDFLQQDGAVENIPAIVNIYGFYDDIDGASEWMDSLAENKEAIIFTCMMLNVDRSFNWLKQRHKSYTDSYQTQHCDIFPESVMGQMALEALDEEDFVDMIKALEAFKSGKPIEERNYRPLFDSLYALLTELSPAELDELIEKYEVLRDSKE